MMMHTIMEELQHFQACPQGEGHLVVALAGQPSNRFEVTEVVRQGTALVLQCQPVASGGDPAPPSPREASGRVFIADEDAEPLSFHDPRRLYEDLR